MAVHREPHKPKSAQEGVNVSEIPQAKACKMLEDGEVNGEPLTPAQRGLFGAICSGQPQRAESGALIINSALMDVLMETPNMKVPADEE